MIIFRSNTPSGKAFDVALLISIFYSILVVVLETVPGLTKQYYQFFFYSEWVITILFTIEFIFRLMAVTKMRHYLFSFYGVVDFLAILPAYLSLIFTGAHYLVVIRVIRLLRFFRIFKLARFLIEARVLMNALKGSRYKISIFFSSVMAIVLIFGSVMYFVEGPENGFTSIPMSIYWCIVTITTVGYGDITPLTAAGKMISSLLMITGYSIIAVPTGIVTAELTNPSHGIIYRKKNCNGCKLDAHEFDARFCKRCGTKL